MFEKETIWEFSCPSFVKKNPILSHRFGGAR
jgi:hypothetical protein